MHATGGNRGIGAHGGERMSGRAGGRASQRIVEQLRRSIRERRLIPGDRLPPERELCEQYGVSRVTIREALRVLEASGLVDIRLGSHGGAFVTSPTAGDAADALQDFFTLSGVTTQEIYEVRLALEPGLVPLACARASEDDLERLGQVYDELEQAWQQGRYDLGTVRTFHLHLARAARNEAAELLLWPIFDALTGADPGDEGTQAREEAGAQERDVDAHRLLLDAVRQRDADLAATRMRALIEQSTT